MNETTTALDVVRPVPTALEMIQAALAQGITSESVATVRELISLRREMDADEAKRAFAAAFVALQAEMPTFVAKTIIPNRGKYERFEDLMEVVGPLLTKHGFSTTFSMDFKENRILETCHLMHVGGHSRDNTFAVRASAKADSETQADCKAATTAKRNALCNALNLVIRQDCLTEENDPRSEGAPITAEQAFELERRVKETNSNREAFLKLAGADRFSEILSGKFPVLDGLLKKKEGRK